jgi:Mycothiol maleylpyruvate isomerase N-terminal domain.
MTVDRSYVEENRTQLERLRALVDRLSDQELSRPMEAGWTVAGVLAHLAFWDFRIVTLLEQWGPDGRGPAPRVYDETAVDWINDASKPLCNGLAPRAAARMAIEAALTADQRVAGLTKPSRDEPGRGEPHQRAAGRAPAEHLDEIERALATAKKK